MFIFKLLLKENEIIQSISIKFRLFKKLKTDAKMEMN